MNLFKVTPPLEFLHAGISLCVEFLILNRLFFHTKHLKIKLILQIQSGSMIIYIYSALPPFKKHPVYLLKPLKSLWADNDVIKGNLALIAY